MDEALLTTCYEFTDYWKVIEEGASWFNYRSLMPVCAYICQAKRAEPNPVIMDLCKKIVQANNGIFSYFRGTMEPLFVTYISCDNDPEAKMLAAKDAYECLKNYFPGSDMTAVLAMVMTDLVPYGEYRAAAANAKMLYRDMKDYHFFLTGSEDILLAGLLAFTYGYDRRMIDEAEASFSILKKKFSWHGNAMQSAAQAMTMCAGTPYEKSMRTIELFDRIRDAGMKYGKDFEIVSLAILANLGIELPQIVNDLDEIDRFLSNQQGYGIFSLTERNRLMHAVMILTVYYLNDSTALMCSAMLAVILEIRAQQAAAAAAAA